MSRYFKAAFWIGWNVPGLGKVPVNLLGVVGLGILGFGEHAFWLLGLGLETGFLTLVATNPRFQKLVDGQSRGSDEAAARARRQELVGKLSRGAREKLSALEEKCARTLQVYREAQADAWVIEGNRDALDRLGWIYLKLLIARDHLQATEAQVNRTEIERRIADLEKALADPARPAAPAGAALRESQQATLKLLRQRLASLARSGQTREEVESGLERIEAQVDLVLDDARLHGPSEVAPGTIELASQLLIGDVDYGESGDAVSALDEAYLADRPRRAAAAQQQGV
jgi:hypothetical protein